MDQVKHELKADRKARDALKAKRRFGGEGHLSRKIEARIKRGQGRWNRNSAKWSAREAKWGRRWGIKAARFNLRMARRFG